ncbi:hypothetical protein [Aquimarina sp. AU474]|uniref:hypothetical protein n=1 Tax=Aquimarina sp. AU474 TaxID=2108529 RepID=UPI000D6A0148|nr:hypothetical protein [Aquimarina sp. AU474]
MFIFKALIILNLGWIVYQDLKSRAVYWFLIPSLIVQLGYLHYTNVLQTNFLSAIIINIGIIFAIISILYLYAILKIKKPFFKEVFGLGDMLFFLALAIAFPTITFIVVFVFSLFFSLFLWLTFKNKSKYHTLPLAGYMALFLILILIGNWLTNAANLYLI